MAEPPPDDELEPVPEGTRDGARRHQDAGADASPHHDTGAGARRHLGIAVALIVVAAVVVVGAIQVVGLLTMRGSAVVAPSASSGAASGGSAPSGVSASPGASPGSPGASPGASPAPSDSSASGSSSSPGLIALVDDSGALTTMDDHGGSRVSYPMPGVVFGFPTWSPDGSRIAVTGDGPTDTAIYVFTVPLRAPASPTASGPGSPAASGPASPPVGSPAVGGPPVVIYRSPDRPPFYLYWTPDGRAVAFLATESVGLSLRIAPADGSAPLDGSGPASIVRLGAPLYFDLLDAGRLLLHVGSGSGAFVGEVGLGGASVQPAVPGTGVFRSASVSRDGRYLAYVRADTGASGQLVVASSDGSTSHEMPVFGPAAFVFDPTGDRLASIAAEAPVDPAVGVPIGPLRLMDAGTGAVRTLLDSSVIGFFWSPDGRTIAALRLARPGDDQVTAGTGVVLADAQVPGTAPTPGVAGAPGVTLRLTFLDVSTGAVRPERVIRLADHFVTQLLPYFDQYALSHRLWSPDSASILLPLVDTSGHDQLVVVPADGSAPRPVAGGAKGFWSP